MLTLLHKSSERGQADHGWLTARHSFSFAEFYDPERMGFGALRVLNDDIIAPGKGFSTHPHRNMEIVTVPLEGALEHKDSMGNGSVIRNGEVQLMSAGTGVRHSEFNASNSELVNLLQIWVLPEKLEIEPRYEQMRFDAKERLNRWQVLVSPIGSDFNSVKINQDAYFSLTDLRAGQALEYKIFGPKHLAYVFVIDGHISADRTELERRDAAGFADESEVKIAAATDSQVLVIEVPR